MDDNGRELRDYVNNAIKRTGRYRELVEKYGENSDSIRIVLNTPYKMKVFSWDGEIDTVTLYVNPARFHDHIKDVIKAAPDRVIMNPGTEDKEHEKMLTDSGIKVQRACTLVLLSQNLF